MRRAKHCRNHASNLLNCDCCVAKTRVASLRSAVQTQVADSWRHGADGADGVASCRGTFSPCSLL